MHGKVCVREFLCVCVRRTEKYSGATALMERPEPPTRLTDDLSVKRRRKGAEEEEKE